MLIIKIADQYYYIFLININVNINIKIWKSKEHDGEKLSKRNSQTKKSSSFGIAEKKSKNCNAFARKKFLLFYVNSVWF